MRGLIFGLIGFAVGIGAAFFVEMRTVFCADPSSHLAEPDPLEEVFAEIDQYLPPAEAHAFRVERLLAEKRRLGAVLAQRRDGNVRDAAAAMGVPDDALRAALDAYLDESPANVDRLSRHGAAGFRALVALLRGGLRGSPRLFRGCWRPSLQGEERALIDVAESDAFDAYSRRAALRALGETDTPAAREYVVNRVRTETDAELFLCAGEAAAQLRDPRALPDLHRGFRNMGWDWNVRSGILHALVEVAGKRAHDVLIDYLREPDADMLGAALSCLEKIDPRSARDEAAALLAGPRAATLTSLQLADLRHYAAQK